MIVALVLAALACYRATRIVTTDRIADRPRDWVIGRWPGSFGYLVTCDWCASIWLGVPFAAVAVVWPTNRVVLVVLAALAVSAVTGRLADSERVDG